LIQLALTLYEENSVNSSALTQAMTLAKKLASIIDAAEMDDKVTLLNEVRGVLHACSPFAMEPVDFVEWVKQDKVRANDYNPNSVAPPEMELLAHSILSDGYTQPIVAWPVDDVKEVVDGFHRNRVGKENKEVSAKVNGYLPVVTVKEGRHDKNDRMASTIRHNRARGKHKVESMSEIVVELKRRKWSDTRIAKELGMEPDEVLRLSQVSGLASLFADSDFSQAWEAERLSDED
jgi:ParB-like chromosome segregation protein Spo0J